jgi:hypothetical protein
MASAVIIMDDTPEKIRKRLFEKLRLKDVIKIDIKQNLRI